MRLKNTKSILVKNIIDACVGSLMFYLVGFGFAFGRGNAFIGNLETFEVLTFLLQNLKHFHFFLNFVQCTVLIKIHLTEYKRKYPLTLTLTLTLTLALTL